MEEKRTFTIPGLQKFVQVHVEQKAEHKELPNAGIKDRESLDLYMNAMLEGLINGIVMAGGKVEGIETD